MWCGFHLSRPVQVQGRGRRIGSRGDAYASSLSIGFPSFSVGGEGDKGEGVRIPGAYVLHSLPLNDEARSGRRDLNPQPQPWQGYALPLSYFRQRGKVKERSTTEQFTYHNIRMTSVFPAGPQS
ncbi:hypothetical protein Salat_2976400 [Sesamum alatum]|uniref:Uncharacterized protein n=1 Tax=Sesamum alatum TaxID=300844 RepID=A0AAE1XIH4_9LAMI|nr:hypothetical protein Salat_2976400 [Sesamum alatum]